MNEQPIGFKVSLDSCKPTAQKVQHCKCGLSGSSQFSGYTEGAIIASIATHTSILRIIKKIIELFCIFF